MELSNLKTLLLMSLEKFDISYLLQMLHQESGKYDLMDIVATFRE